MLLKFFKKYSYYFFIILIPLNIFSCFLNGFCVEYLFAFFVFAFLSCIFTFLEIKIFHKGFISDKSVGTLLFSLIISIIFLILSFIYKYQGYTNLSIAAVTTFLTLLLIVKIYDIKKE